MQEIKPENYDIFKDLDEKGFLLTVSTTGIATTKYVCPECQNDLCKGTGMQGDFKCDGFPF